MKVFRSTSRLRFVTRRRRRRRGHGRRRRRRRCRRGATVVFRAANGADDEKCELIDANDENEACAHAQAHAHAHAWFIAVTHAHVVSSTAATAGARWRYATCAHTRAHTLTHATRWRLSATRTRMHACVTSSYLSLRTYVCVALRACTYRA